MPPRRVGINMFTIFIGMPTASSAAGGMALAMPLKTAKLLIKGGKKNPAKTPVKALCKSIYFTDLEATKTPAKTKKTILKIDKSNSCFISIIPR